VEGNERADAEVKGAVEEGSSEAWLLPPLLRDGELPISIAAAGGAVKKDMRARWKAIWVTSPRHARLSKIDAKLPSHAFLHATDDLTRAQASILMQLHTGHAPLNGFLGKVSSPQCPACQRAEETVHHYLFDCPMHAHARHGLVRMLGRLSKSLRHLLRKWHAFRPLLKYVGETGRFRSTYGDLPMKTI